jgi:hypothetical protein
MVELKHRDRFLPKRDNKSHNANDPFDDAHLYLGLSGTRGMLCVSPELEKFVGKQLSDEYMAIKERRKALEARQGDKK